MKKIYTSVAELVGKTPLLQLDRYAKAHDLKANIIGKLEYFNPAGSIKDRIALAMIEKGEKDGLIKQGTTIIEATSGNTGIGLASIAASRGYKMILTMPETMSVERRKLLAAYGARIELTPGSLGMKGAIAKATELAKEVGDAFIPSQFENPANPDVHIRTTGPEIYSDTNGEVDIFVSAIGTGGTITGAGKYLKEQNPNIKVVGVEPMDSPVLSGGAPGPHKIQGIGAGFVPNTLDTKVYDEIVKVTNDQAFTTAREMARLEGVLVGISSGSALYAAKVIASRPENAGKNIVVILPDTGERYLSTELFI